MLILTTDDIQAIIDIITTVYQQGVSHVSILHA